PTAVPPRAPKPVTAPAAKRAVVPAAPSEAAGTVVDQVTGKPMASAYVVQPGSLNGVLTDGLGRFKLILDPKYGTDLHVSHDSFESLQLTAKAEPMTVKLSPIAAYRPYTALTTQKTSQRAIDSLFNLYYQLQNENFASGDGQLNGLISNQLMAQGQFRLGNFLVRGEGSRNRIPVDVEGFPYKPTVSFDTWQARLGASYVLNLGTPLLDVAIGPEYQVNFIQGDNRSGADAKPIPFTNTFMDRFPLRQGLGANLLLGFRPIERLYIAADTSYHPFVFSNVEAGSAPLGNMQYVAAGIRADYAFFTGVGVGVAYRYFNWFGDIKDTANQFSIGLSFNPALLNN
ncbi:MAG: hypothetical protein H7338_18455, partial [Candidatus Sericytochromatia bacterium]|nr:hypothetical protein [Candidatus Sericytochromatia bacterium]